MSCHCSNRTQAPLYFVEHQGKRARYFPEVDRDSNSLAAVIDLIIKGEVDPVKVLEVDEAEGTCRDVTAEIMAAINHPTFDRPNDADRQAWAFDHARGYRDA